MPIPGIYPRQSMSLSTETYVHPCFTTTPCTIAMAGNQPGCTTIDEQIKYGKMKYVIFRKMNDIGG